MILEVLKKKVNKVLSACIFTHTVLLPLLGQDYGQHPVLRSSPHPPTCACVHTYNWKKVTWWRQYYFIYNKMKERFPGTEMIVCLFPFSVEHMQWPVSFQTFFFFRFFLHFLKNNSPKISGFNELLLLLLLVCGSWLARDMFYNLITHTKSMNHSSTNSQRLSSAKNMLCINHWRKSKSFWFCFIKLFRIHTTVNLNHKVSFL